LSHNRLCGFLFSQDAPCDHFTSGAASISITAQNLHLNESGTNQMQKLIVGTRGGTAAWPNMAYLSIHPFA
jgi:hypothetical protein